MFECRSSSMARYSCKEMLFNSPKTLVSSSALYITSSTITTTSNFKFLRVQMVDIIYCSLNTLSLVNEAQPLFYFLHVHKPACIQPCPHLWHHCLVQKPLHFGQENTSSANVETSEHQGQDHYIQKWFLPIDHKTILTSRSAQCLF